MTQQKIINLSLVYPTAMMLAIIVAVAVSLKMTVLCSIIYSY